MVKVRWFYHPEETKGNSVPLVDKRVSIYFIHIITCDYFTKIYPIVSLLFVSLPLNLSFCSIIEFRNQLLICFQGALFESSHFDVNDVQTISHKCQVISWQEYQLRKKENLITLDDPPNVYYLAGQYDALNGRIKMETNVPLKEKQSKD